MARSPERVQFLSDILTTAIEGGIGYWSQCLAYQWTDDGEAHPCVNVNACKASGREDAFAVIVEVDDCSEGGYRDEQLVIDSDVIAKGLARILDRKVSYPESSRKRLRDAARDNDAGEIDADDADCIVQAGLLGTIVYG